MRRRPFISLLHASKARSVMTIIAAALLKRTNNLRLMDQVSKERSSERSRDRALEREDRASE